MKKKSIVAAALVGVLTLGSSVFAFASTSSDVNLDIQTTVSTSSEDTTSSDDTSSSSTCGKSHSNKRGDSDSSNHRNHRGSSVKVKISALIDEGYTLEDAKATVLAEKLAEIDAKVTDGTLTSEEAESYKEKITEKITNYTGEETTGDMAERKHKKNGSRKSKSSSSGELTDDTASNVSTTK